MAYDLRRIAPEKELPTVKAAWKRWSLAFVLVAGGGSLGALSWWPASESTHTAWFWLCAVVFPFLAWLTPFLFYLGAMQSRRRSAVEYNKDRKNYIQIVQRDAGIPLHVVASGFLFSSDDHENTPLAVIGNDLLLEPRIRFLGDDQTITARWIEPPGGAWRPGADGADFARQQELFTYVLHSLIAQIAPAIRAMPEHIRIVPVISVDAPFELPNIEKKWREAWAEHQLGSETEPHICVTPPTLISVDGWLDGDDTFPSNAVMALCVIRINPLLNALPEKGAAEAGVVLLLASALLASRMRLTSQALLYRPERGNKFDLGHKLIQVLMWSRTDAPEVSDHWFTGGAEAPPQRALTDELHALGIAAVKTADPERQHDLDRRIGDAGLAAPWLNVALACNYASQCGHKQLISVAQENTVTLAIIAPCL